MEYYEFRAMNTGIVLAAEGNPQSLKPGFREAQTSIEAYERRFSRFLPDSELSQLNRSQGSWFEASPDLFELVDLAIGYSRRTGGLFDPSILPALKQAGYDRSMDELRLYGPAKPAQPSSLVRPDLNTLELDQDGRRIRLPVGMELDLGGIAKGWIAWQASRLLERYANACAVNAGGDLALVGLPAGQVAWELGLEDPRQPEQDLAILKVGPGAVATSSVAKRTWMKDGKARHHLIDPRSGEPADTAWLSVTVVAPNATEAEVFAKVILLAGPGGVGGILSQDPELAFIAVDRQGKLWGSPNAKELIDVAN